MSPEKLKELEEMVTRLEIAAETHCIITLGDQFEKGEPDDLKDRIHCVALYLEETV